MLLLLIIYIAFIGLGIPDSLFGTAWPPIYTEFGLPLSFGSFVTVAISCSTVISSIFSAKLIRKFGTSRVSAVSTLMTALALLGFSFTPNLWTMCALAIPLGLGAGTIDVALNNYVSLHYSAVHMNFLHCFYGIGVCVSPYILSLVINGDAGWRGGYRYAFALQAAITVLMFVTLPVWKKEKGGKSDDASAEMKALTFREALAIPGVKLMCLLFVTSTAIECSCGGWGSTFLVEYKHISAEAAARVVTFYYIGMTFGRFLSGVFATKLHSWKIIAIGEIILGAALVLILLPAPVYVCAIGMFLIGFGNGPLFPNLNYLTPENFGADVSQSVMGVQMSTAYVGIMLAPMLCGVIGQTLGMWTFPIYLSVFYIIMVPATIRAKKMLGKKV